MPLRVPNLDDRDWQSLVDEAVSSINNNLDTTWNDLTPGDPGMVLLEAFAYLTEQMIFRLNQLPDKAYVAFLRMLGVTLYPPNAATTTLKLWHAEDAAEDTVIPFARPVTIGSYSGEGEPPVFVTADEVTITPTNSSEATAVDVTVVHCEWHAAERLGVSSGQPGQTFQLAAAPVIANLGPDSRLNLAIGVEVTESESTHEDWIAPDGKRFRIWQETGSFANLQPGAEAYVVDRQEGSIQFAPAARLTRTDRLDTVTRPFAAIPVNGREIRAWYASGGGELGNIPHSSLDAFVDLPGQPTLDNVALTNPVRAVGGREAETLDNALRRGPYEVHSLERAVTARDFENLTVSAGAKIERARAFTKAGVWRYANPGTVEVAVVPFVEHAARDRISEQDLVAARRPETLDEVKAMLQAKSPLGTRVEVTWARLKKVWITANLLLKGNESPDDVQRRVEDRLHRIISPLPQRGTPEQISDLATGEQPLDEVYERRLEQIYADGWPFGRQLSLADVSRFILSTEANVSLINALAIHLEDVPAENVTCVVADYFQKQTWYAASDNRLLRSINDGKGWEHMITFAPDSGSDIWVSTGGIDTWDWAREQVRTQEIVNLIAPCPYKPGVVAMCTRKETGSEFTHLSGLYLSMDSATTWYRVSADNDAEINDLVWLQRGNSIVLLMASSLGLLEVNLPLTSQNVPRKLGARTIPVLSDEEPEASNHHPVYAVTVIDGEGGHSRVVVALKHRRGVYISDSPYLASRPDQRSFKSLGLKGEDVRHLNVQESGNQRFLWAGTMAQADNGRGCYRWQFDDVPRRIPEGDRWVSAGWTGGSCYAVDFLEEGEDDLVFAVTAWGGVLKLRIPAGQPNARLTWDPLEHQGLPLRGAQLTNERDFFVPLQTIATNENTESGKAPILMVGGAKVVYRSTDFGASYETISRRVYRQLKDEITIPQDYLLISGPHAITAVREQALSTDTHDGGLDASA